MIMACVSAAGASATLLLEEPYGKMGYSTATGHAAVYLPAVCADSPIVLRRCAPGETGIVLSRYDGIDGYDWLAIPLIPYLYAVERPEDIPLFADAKMVAFLRDQYRRKYLEEVAPDAANGEAPGGIWYQLVGSSYDRTIYGFEIKTTPEQDDALIRKLNSSPNRSHFHLASNNCADFARQIIDFYYPKSLHRSLIADVGITSSEQLAKMLTKFNAHHPETQLSRMVIAQVPGSMPRSSAPRGVVESFLKIDEVHCASVIVSPSCGQRCRRLCRNGRRPLSTGPRRKGLRSGWRPRAPTVPRRPQGLSPPTAESARRIGFRDAGRECGQRVGEGAVKSKNGPRRRGRPDS